MSNFAVTTTAMLKRLLCVIILCFSFSLVTAQNTNEKKEIIIDFAGFAEKNEEKYPDAVVLTRNDQRQVQITHKGATIWCDQAVHYAQDDFIEAYGNVKMIQGDTIQLNSNYAEYSGKTELAIASGDVVLTDPNSTLTTNKLFFDRTKQQAFYETNGKVVRDTSGTITSKIGRYFTKTKQYRFRDSVNLKNPEYVLKTNWLDYYTGTGHAYMYGPSTITSDSSKVYTERGFYDTKEKLGTFVKNSKIFYNNRTVEGDSLFFNQAKSFASATNNITVTDTLNNSIFKGHYAEVFRDKDSVYITKRALAITVQDQDSVYMHSDTIMVTGKPDHRIIRSFRNVKLFKSDLSGKADSVHTDQNKGVTQLINIARLHQAGAFSKPKKPVLWNVNNQMTGDTIYLYANSKSEKLDSLVVYNNAFLASEDTLKVGFNQISGKRLIGLFNANNDLKTVDIKNNAESIYFLRNDENELVGIDKSRSADIKIFLSENTIDEVRKLNLVDGKVHPESMFPKNARQLRGFVWRSSERPLSVADLFADDPPLNLPIIKGLDPAMQYETFFDEALIKRIEDADKIESDRQTPEEKADDTKKANRASRLLPKKVQDSLTSNQNIQLKPPKEN